MTFEIEKLKPLNRILVTNLVPKDIHGCGFNKIDTEQREKTLTQSEKSISVTKNK